MREIPKYSYRVFWSSDDNEFVATCTEVPGLSGLGPSEAEAIGELKTALAVWLDHLESEGVPAPEPAQDGFSVIAHFDLQLKDIPPSQAQTASTNTATPIRYAA